MDAAAALQRGILVALQQSGGQVAWRPISQLPLRSLIISEGVARRPDCDLEQHFC
jgi:hypothetical protein